MACVSENLSRCSAFFRESDGVMNAEVSGQMPWVFVSHVSSHIAFCFISVFSACFPMTYSHEKKMLFPFSLHSKELRRQGNEYCICSIVGNLKTS